MGDFLKWGLVALAVLLAYRWMQNGIQARLGPASTFGGVDLGAVGFIPMGRGGLQFGANIPWGN